MEQSVQLVIAQITELCKVLGLKVTEYYPYVLKQQFIYGLMALINFFVGIALMIPGGLIISKKTSWKKNKDPNGRGTIGIVILVVGVVLTLISFAVLLTVGIGQLINPNYYAVKEILRLVVTRGHNG